MIDLLVLAAGHAESLKADILLCKTREEHIRITARANEADLILEKIKKVIKGGESGDE